MADKPESPHRAVQARAGPRRALAGRDCRTWRSSSPAEGPHLSGHRAVLPHPPRDLNPREAARIRGLADQMALRLAHHDDAAHAGRGPARREGQPVYDALEQARIEAIGANALGGVRDNLRAALEARLERQGLNQARGTGQRAAGRGAGADGARAADRRRRRPTAPRPWSTMFRAEIESQGRPRPRPAGRPRSRTRRPSPASPARSSRDLEMGDDQGDPDASDDERGRRAGARRAARAKARARTRATAPRPASPRPARATRRESEDADSQMIESEDEPTPRSWTSRRHRRRRQAGAAAIQRPGRRPSRAYKVFTTAYDEVVAAEELCDAEELTRLRAYLDQQLASAVQRGLAPGQPAAAQAAGQAEPRLDLRPRGRRARRRAPDPGDRRPHRAALVQGGDRTPSSATRWSPC